MSSESGVVAEEARVGGWWRSDRACRQCCRQRGGGGDEATCGFLVLSLFNKLWCS